MLTSKPGKTLSTRHLEVQQTSSLSPRDAAQGQGHPKAKKTRSLSRSYSVKDLTEDTTELASELSIDDRLPGVLKIFGESVLAGAEYKSVLASTRSTAQELVKQALERYGQPTGLYVDYVLCDVIGLVENSDSGFSQRPNKKWRTVCQRVLEDHDRPLELQSFWKPCNGFSRRYELNKRMEVVREQASDDTSGLNDNARKIMMAKVAPGAIPLSTTWNGDSSQFRIHTHSVQAIQRETMSDNSVTSSPNLNAARLPHLLTIRGYNVLKDQIQYPMKSKNVTIGKFRGQSSASEIGLSAPDVLSQHCRLALKLSGEKDSIFVNNRYSYIIEMDVCDGAVVSLNGRFVSGIVSVCAGDIISIGKHYMFLFKDPSKGHDIPEKPVWFQPMGNDIPNLVPRNRSQMDFLNYSLAASTDFSASFDAGEGSGGGEGQRVTFAYAKDKEDELVKAVAEMYTCTKRDHPLTPAVVLVACMDHAHRKFTRHHLRSLQHRVLFCIREKVADLAKELSAQRYESSVFDYTSPTPERDPLKHLVFWMSNSVHLYVHVLHDLHVQSVTPDPDDESYTGLQELVTGLEDVVSFSFQQTVYSVTKILYHVVGKVMESNPFSGVETWDRDGIGHVISVLQTTRNIASDVKLHGDVITQLMTYLLFFLNTSLFNRLITTECESDFYTWSFGVRLQANLSRLEEWSVSKQLETQFKQVSEPISATADLLAMSKNILLKMDWPSFRSQFTALNESQLLKLLRGYHLGKHKTPPEDWFPAEGGVSNPNEEDLPINLSSHPTFTLPKEGCPLDMNQHFPEGFFEYLEHFQNLYGTADDDSDSGLSVSNTPRVSDSRPPRENKTFYIDSPRGRPRDIPKRNDPSPSRPPSTPNSARSSASSNNWKPRSQERPPAHSERSRSLSGPPEKRVPLPVPQKRKPLNRVPPLDLPDDINSRRTLGLPYNKNISKSTDNLLGQSSIPSHPPRGSILKSPRTPGQRSNGSVNFEDVKRYPEDVYVGVQRMSRSNSAISTGNSFISDVQNQAGLSSDYDVTQPCNRRSLPYEDNDILSGLDGDVVSLELDKGGSQLGLGLIDGLHTPLKSPGIFVKNLLVDSPAHRCGQLGIGDQVLSVNGHTVLGEAYESAMNMFRTSGPKLRLTVSKSEQAVVDLITAARC